DTFGKQRRLRSWLGFDKTGHDLSPIAKKPV
ncbi:MAG: hypothetical protein ACI9SP_000898, partial [Arenicella sp.]